MRESEPDKFHKEMVRKTQRDSDAEFLRRTGEEDRLAVTDFQNDQVVQLIRNRIGPVRSSNRESEFRLVEHNAHKILLQEQKRLKQLNPEERRQLLDLLLVEEGHDLKRGTTKELGASPNVTSIGIDINTLEFMTSSKIGEHYAVIGKLAQKIGSRNLARLEDESMENYKGEAQIVYGLIHKNVTGWKLPLARMFVDSDTRSYTNLYINSPRTLSILQMREIKKILRDKIHVLPMDKLCSPF